MGHNAVAHLFFYVIAFTLCQVFHVGFGSEANRTETAPQLPFSPQYQT